MNKINYIYYYKCKCKNGTNFGDMITPYIFKKITNKKPIYTNNSKKKYILFGAGSILNNSKNNSIIWGTGSMYEDSKFSKPHKIYSVRGKLTRDLCLKLGYDCPEIFGDIGLLLPKFYRPKISKKFKIGIIPHYIDFEICNKLFNNSHDIIVIDLTNNIENVIDLILSCDYTISSSLHGIIASHAYDIKSLWCEFSNDILGNGFKFYDYYSSLCDYKKKNIKPFFIDKKYNANFLANKINNYYNPKFPINTTHILECCPFYDKSL